MPACIVKGCHFHWRQRDPDVTLHVFPRNPEMIKKWLLQIYCKEDGLDELVTKIQTSKKGVYRICSKHFGAECYERKTFGKVFRKDAVPTIFPWTQPYPLEEERQDHPYAKKKRLHTCLADESTHAASADDTTVQLPDTSTPRSIPKSQESVMSQFASKILTDNFPESPTTQFFDVRTTEDGSFLSACQSVEEIGCISRPSFHRQRGPYQPRTRRTIGTLTNFFPAHSNKAVQFDKSMGTTNKSVQACRRPPHRSIALQCNLANLPVLSRARKRSEVHRPADPSTDPSLVDIVDQYMTVQVMEEEEEPSSPGMSSVQSSSNAEFDTMDQLEVEHEEASVSQFEHFEERFGSFVEVTVEEDSQLGHESKPVTSDPKDDDMTPVFLPESQTPTHHVNDRKFIVFESCLNKLFMCCKCLGMRDCPGNIVKVKKYRIGSAVLVNAICSLKHDFHLWTSQPMVGEMPVGNLLLSSGILCSGSSFYKLESFFRLVGILGISQSTYHKSQNLYLFPAVDHHWKLERRSIIQGLQSRPVVLVGECKPSTSPAKCCTYSFLEYQTKKIMDFEVEALDPSLTPTALEEQTFQTALDRLLEERLNVRVICTDRRAEIRKLLKKHYGRIKHQYDVWHVARSVASKISKASRKHDCRQLSRWIRPVKNHLWWSTRTSQHNPALLREKWVSVVNHASNQHQWGGATLYDSCYHKEEEDHQEWLTEGSKAHRQLKDIVLDKNLLKDLRHLSDFCNPEELQVFHSIGRKYRDKRSRYSIDSSVARSQLAALDYNRNINWIQRVLNTITCSRDGQGDQTWYGHSQAGKDAVISNICESSNQDFIKEILADVLSVAAGKKSFGWTSREVSRNVTPLPRPARPQMLNKFIYRFPQTVE